MKELIIANNMIAIARGHKPKKHKTPKGHSAKHTVAPNKTPGQKRSAMLKMVMPFLSRETGEKLALAIGNHDANKFAALWDQVKKEIVGKLEAQKHHALASDNPERDFAFDLNYEDAEKLVRTFKWVLSRLCKPEVEQVDPCPMEPIEVDPCCAETPVANPVVVPTVGIEAYPQIAELYAQMLASEMQS
jgi:hypothetical protein